MLQYLPHDDRDNLGNDTRVVLIRSVKTRMTGQPKTGYLLWGAAVILARWTHINRYNILLHFVQVKRLIFLLLIEF